MVKIVIFKKHIQTKNIQLSKTAKKKFLAELINSIKSLNMEHISSKESLEQVVPEFAYNTDKIWFKHSKLWWNKKCQREIEKYRASR